MSSEPGSEELEILQALGQLVAATQAYRRQLVQARPILERLSADYGPAATLLQSLALAETDPPNLGTPRHIELATAAALADLRIR